MRFHEDQFNFFILYKWKRGIKLAANVIFFIIDIHGASIVKHLNSIKDFRIVKFIPSNFSNESNESNNTKQKIYKPKSLREKSREKNS